MVEQNGEETDADGEPGNVREGARVAIDHGFDDQESERATSDQRGESGRSPESTQDAASASIHDGGADNAGESDDDRRGAVVVALEDLSVEKSNQQREEFGSEAVDE